MNRDFDKQRIRLKITEHIFTNSPTMVALCLTTEGLIKIYAAVQKITTLADDLLIFSLAGFLLATIFSYLALRSANLERRVRLAAIADGSFLGGLSMAIVVAVFIVFTLAG